MIDIGCQHELEVLVRLHQTVDDLQGRPRGDCPVHLACGQQKLALEAARQRRDGDISIVRTGFGAHEFLGEVRHQHLRIVVGRSRHARLEHIGIGEHGPQRGVTASGAAHDTGTREVDGRIALRQLAKNSHMVVKMAREAEFSVGLVEEGLGTPRRAATVHLDDDEPQLRIGLGIVEQGVEQTRMGTPPLRARVERIDDGIGLFRVIVRRSQDDPVERGLAVSRQGAEALRQGKSAPCQSRHVRLFDLSDELAVRAP